MYEVSLLVASLITVVGALLMVAFILSAEVQRQLAGMESRLRSLIVDATTRVVLARGEIPEEGGGFFLGNDLFVGNFPGVNMKRYSGQRIALVVEPCGS